MRLKPDHPDRLSKAATLVVWACPYLTEAQKLVWFHHWDLDRDDPDGCYMKAESMSARLGGTVSARTIEDFRGWLRSRDLAVGFPRPGCRQFGWIMTLPKLFMPTSDRVSEVAGQMAERLGRELAEHLRRRDDGLGLEGSAGQRVKPPPQRGSTVRSRTGVGSAPERSVSPVEGGKGGALPPLDSEREAQLPPRLRSSGLTTNAEDGVVAHATEKRGGVRRVGDMITRLHEDIEQRREASGG